MRIACYERVSTEQQAGPDKTSLGDQRVRCEAYARQLGATSIVHFADAFTGSELVRPQLDRLIRLVESNEVDGVVFWKVDRAGRESLVSLQLYKTIVTDHGIRMFDAHDKMELTEQQFIYEIKAVMASYERKQILERMSAAKRIRAAAGKVTSNIRLYGYTLVKGEKRLVGCPNEADVVRKVFHWCATEGIGSYTIARRLAEEGIRSPRGGTVTKHGKVYSFRWNYEQVWEMLHNRTYVDGIIHRKGEQEDWQPLRVEPLVDQKLWDAAQRVCERRRRFRGRGAPARQEYLSQRLVFCGHCGRAMAARPSRQTTKSCEVKIYTYYICPRRYQRSFSSEGDPVPKCPQVPVNARDIDDAVWQLVLTSIKQPQRYLGILSKDAATADVSLHERRQDAERLLAAARAGEERIHDAWSSGILTEKSKYRGYVEDFRRRSEVAEADLRSIESVARQQQRLPLDAAALLKQAEQIAARSTVLTFGERQEILREWVRRIVITDLDITVEGVAPLVDHAESIEKKAMKKIGRELHNEREG